MSRKAKEEFKEAQRDQRIRNQARNILRGVDSAQGDKTYAAKRWPFELLQNAHDTGPRRGRGQIKFSLRLDTDCLVVKHDGQFFSNQDLAALLSGGSNKGYDDDETTGRFGTGFLMTHAVSARPTVEGILERGDREYEHFEIELNRTGDEEAIERNIEESQDAIGVADPISWEDIDGLETAEFIYPLDDSGREVALEGIDRFREALPYLFATCENLGTVRIEVDGKKQVWAASSFESIGSNDETQSQFREIEVRGGKGSRLLRTVTTRPEGNSNVSAIAVLEQEDEHSWCVQPPSDDLPRIFVQFPIASTETLPFNCVLDGRFEPEIERDALKFEDSQADLEDAVRAIPPLLELGASENWKKLHHLAYLSEPMGGVSRSEDDEEVGWWRAQIKEVAERLSSLKIIQADGAATPKEVSFLYSSYRKDSDTSFDFESMYKLARLVSSLRVIQHRTAREWASVAKGWETLEVSLQRLGLKELADHVQKGVDHIDDLPVESGERKWLADFLSLLVEVRESKNYSVVLDGIIPNQNGKLGSLESLSFDQGIPEPLKDVAEELGDYVRSQLLDLPLQQTIRDTGERVFLTVKNETGKNVTTNRIVNQCLNKLDSLLKDEARVEDLDGDAKKYIKASTKLICILDAESNKTQSIQRCPLLKKDEKVSRVSPEHTLMAPEDMWPDSAEKFAEIYPESLVLHTWYNGSDVGREAVEILAQRELLHKAPLIHGARSKIEGDLLRQISARDEEIDSQDRLRDEEFTQIAKLYQVLSRCKRDRDLAQAVLGFVLNHAVVEDSSWRESKTVEVYRDQKPREVEVQKALWHAELLDQAWIPVHQEDELTTVSARDAPIMDFIRPEWMRGNSEAHDFLNQVFEVGKLDVVLHSRDEKEREQLEDTLAEITLKGPDTLQALSEQDPSLLADLAEEVREKKKREQKKEENRQFGLAVQKAVKKYLENRGIEVSVDDCGYDFDLRLPGDPTLEDGTHHLECDGRIKMEVKATRKPSVKLTPEQVRTARQQGKCFALCVVDLRHVGDRRIWDEWSADEIEPHTRIIRSVGSEVEGPSRKIEELSESSDTVSICRSDELRYRVHAPYWKRGQRIEAWVSGVLERILT